jgi:hypothetical protein
MIKEIHLAGSVRTQFGGFCGTFVDFSAKSQYE